MSRSSQRLVLLFAFLSYIYISRGSAETHLRCGGVYNNQFIANCLESVPVKEL